MRRAHAYDRGHIEGRTGKDHDVGRMAALQRVSTVDLSTGVVRTDVGRTDGRFELREKDGIQHASA
jgi:hypothetical protein